MVSDLPGIYAAPLLSQSDHAVAEFTARRLRIRPQDARLMRSLQTQIGRGFSPRSIVMLAKYWNNGQEFARLRALCRFNWAIGGDPGLDTAVQVGGMLISQLLEHIGGEG